MKRIIFIGMIMLLWGFNFLEGSSFSVNRDIPAYNTILSVAATGIQSPMEEARNYSPRIDKIFETFEKSPAIVILLYTIIIYSIIALIGLTFFILLNRTRMEKETDLKSALNEKYQQWLISYLFEEGDRKKIFGEIRRIASDSFNRQILINQIIELSVNMQGDAREDLRNLYLDLGLKQDSLRNAYSRKWHKNVKGFRELAFMNIRDANERIIEALNSSNQILRMEAQVALLRLSDENPYDFLHYLEKPLAKWEQITIHELLLQHDLNVPDFRQWFDSENLTILKFSLKMVAWFKQTNSGNQVISLLNHEDEGVRKQAIWACGELALKESLPVLQKMYRDASYDIRTEILKAFSKVPDDAYLDFMNEVLDEEDDVQLQILATKVMENMDEPGISRLIKLMKSKSEYKNYQIIIRHVLDGRIY